MLLEYHLILRALLKDTQVVQVHLPLRGFQWEAVSPSFLYLLHCTPVSHHHSPSRLLQSHWEFNVCFRNVFLFDFMCMTFACMRAFMCTTCMPGAQGIQKEEVVVPGNWLQIVESYHVGARNQTPVLCKSSQCCSC